MRIYFISILCLVVFIFLFLNNAYADTKVPSTLDKGEQKLSYLAQYLMDSADIFLANGEYIQAQRYFERALQEHPDNEYINNKLNEIRKITGLSQTVSAAPVVNDDNAFMYKWEDIQAEIARLTDNNDKEGLEHFYTELSKNEDYFHYAIIGRGYVRAEMGKLEQAREDLMTALAEPDKIFEGQQDIKRTVAQLDAEINRKNELNNIQAVIKSLTDKKDWEGLEEYYTALSANPQHEAMAIYSLGGLHMSRGQMLQARDDFVYFTSLGGVDSKTKTEAVRLIGVIDAAIEQELERERAQRADAGSSLLSEASIDEPDIAEHSEEEIARAAVEDPWVYLLSAKENIAAGDYDSAATELGIVSGLPLDNDALGMYFLLRGDLLRGQGDNEEAYASDLAASESLPEGYFLSEILWRMAEYSRNSGDNESAADYARRSADLSQDNEWRQIGTANILRDFSQWDEALMYYDRALSMDPPVETKLLIYQNISGIYSATGDKERLLDASRGKIDLLNEELAGQEIKDPALENALYAARKEYTYSNKKFGISSYLFGSIYGNGNYLYQLNNELSAHLYNKNWFNLSLYGQINGVLSSKFQGTYFAAWSGSYERYESSSSFGDSLEIVAGLKATTPLPGVSLSVDRVFALGSGANNNTRAILSHYWGKGADKEPNEDRWVYASSYSEATYSITNDDITAFGEARVGYAFGIGSNNMLVPHISGVWGYGGKSIDSLERWSLEAGPGVFFRSKYRESTYSAPKSSFDIIVQYRFGLSHNRENVLSLTLVNNF